MSLSHIRQQREKHAEWEEKGLCTRCGGQRDNEDYKRCAACRAYARRYDRSRRIRLNPTVNYEPSWHPQRDINTVGGVV